MPLINDDHCKSYYSIALREVLLNTNCHKSGSFELCVEFVLDTELSADRELHRVVSDATIGVLWEGAGFRIGKCRRKITAYYWLVH